MVFRHTDVPALTGTPTPSRLKAQCRDRRKRWNFLKDDNGADMACASTCTIMQVNACVGVGVGVCVGVGVGACGGVGVGVGVGGWASHYPYLLL